MDIKLIFFRDDLEDTVRISKINGYYCLSGCSFDNRYDRFCRLDNAIKELFDCGFKLVIQ